MQVSLGTGDSGTGDLSSVRDNLERIITFIGTIARNLGSNGRDLRNKLEKISEMSETLRTRIHYGIHEELFDLALRKSMLPYFFMQI